MIEHKIINAFDYKTDEELEKELSKLYEVGFEIVGSYDKNNKKIILRREVNLKK